MRRFTAIGSQNDRKECPVPPTARLHVGVHSRSTVQSIRYPTHAHMRAITRSYTDVLYTRARTHSRYRNCTNRESTRFERYSVVSCFVSISKYTNPRGRARTYCSARTSVATIFYQRWSNDKPSRNTYPWPTRFGLGRK